MDEKGLTKRQSGILAESILLTTKAGDMGDLASNVFSGQYDISGEDRTVGKSKLLPDDYIGEDRLEIMRDFDK